MEATGRVIKRKYLTLETKQSIHRCLKKKLGSKWSKFREDASLPNGWGDFCRKLINPLLI
jgi:hypothetical protein